MVFYCDKERVWCGAKKKFQTNVEKSLFEVSKSHNIPLYLLYETMDIMLVCCEQ